MKRKRILFVCTGNTCRSPMAKVIAQQKLKVVGRFGDFEIDSAGCAGGTNEPATREARQAIKVAYGEDMLAGHKSKKLSPDLVQWANLVLVMTGSMKGGELPAGKTYTLKEFAGSSGDIADPMGHGQATYDAVAREISATIDRIIPRLMGD